MRIRRKSGNCLNCKSTLDGIYNFCPICGQENNNNNISFGLLIKEFFVNYMALDGRIAKSVFPFFFKPGFLTNEFNAGRRMSYMHPIRMYLIISLFYFFAFELVSQQLVEEGIRKNQEFQNKYGENLDEEELNEIISEAQATNGYDWRKHVPQLNDSLLSNADSVSTNDSLVNQIQENTTPESDTLSSGTENEETEDEDSDSDDDSSNWRILEKYKDDNSLTNEMLYDSLDLDPQTPFKNYLVKQYVRVRRSDEHLVAAYLLDSLPLMMLLLLPLFALILKLLYLRQKILYIKHVIHALHIHSFAYLIYGLTLILIYFFSKNDPLSNWFTFLSVLIVSTHSYISYLNVHKQGWFKTFVKFNFTGFVYVNLLIASLLLELFIAFLLY